MTVRAMLLAVLIACASSTAVAADAKEIERKVAQLNSQSVKLLGVSLNALRYLVGADPNSYLHLGHLENSGDINFVRELQAKGYVRTQTVQALPDGTQKTETFLRVIPVGDGVELQRCIIALQHNPALQQTR